MHMCIPHVYGMCMACIQVGMRHLGYARLAANNKPRHPALAKAVLDGVLADAAPAGGTGLTLTQPIDVQSVGGDGGGGDGEMVLAVHVVACRLVEPAPRTPSSWWSSQIRSFDFQ